VCVGGGEVALMCCCVVDGRGTYLALETWGVKLSENSPGWALLHTLVAVLRFFA